MLNRKAAAECLLLKSNRLCLAAVRRRRWRVRKCNDKQITFHKYLQLCNECICPCFNEEGPTFFFARVNFITSFGQKRNPCLHNPDFRHPCPSRNCRNWCLRRRE